MSTALVTGANRGLGRAIATGLARQGHHVFVTAREERAAQQVVDDLRAAGYQAEPLALDVSSSSSIRAAVSAVESRQGVLDVLVNNAGILPEATAQNGQDFADPAVFADTFAVNVFGALAVTEAFLGLVRKSATGRIVNVSSQMGSLNDQKDADSPYYSMVMPAHQASKAALNSLTIGLSKHLQDTPVKVTSVCPGFVQTDLTPMNREHAPLTPQQAAEIVLHAAMLPAGAESGTFLGNAGQLPW